MEISGLDGQIEPARPFVPRPVVIGQIGVAQPSQVEKDDGRRDATVTVGDRGPVGSDLKFVDSSSQIVQR